MEFKFVIDEYYLSSLFNDAEHNYTEIEWFVNISKHIPVNFGATYITKDLYDKVFNDIRNSDIFYPSRGKARDLAMRFGITYQRYYKKYNKNDFTDKKHESDKDFPTYIINNKLVALITRFDYTKEDWWAESTPQSLSIGDEVLTCVRNLASEVNDCSDDEFMKVANTLFPNIYIHWSNKIKLSNFKISPTPIKWIIESLAYLNDHAVEDYRNSPSLFMEAALKKGIHLSPESTKTRRAARLMKERDIEIKNRSVCCEWHFKYSKTEGGRIHFHFGYDVDDALNETTKGFPIVGIFTNHLPIA